MNQTLQHRGASSLDRLLSRCRRLCQSDVGSDFDDAVWLAVPTNERIVACLQPHLATPFCEALKLSRFELALIQFQPESPILGGRSHSWRQEDRVVLTSDF